MTVRLLFTTTPELHALRIAKCFPSRCDLVREVGH